MAARDSREKKTVERFAPVGAPEKEKHVIFEGSGTELGKIPIVPVNLNKIDANHDLLKAFHSLLYGGTGKKTVRKKNIRSFSGFEDGDDASTEARLKKLTASKKWTVGALKDLCTLLGLERGGGKSDLAERVVSFLASPDPSNSKGPVPKKPKAKKRKSTGKGKKGKKAKKEMKPRPLSGYQMFLRAARPKLMKAEGPLKPTEAMSKLAEMWKECSDAQKEKYKKQGVTEFENKEAAGDTDDQENDDQEEDADDSEDGGDDEDETEDEEEE